MGKRSGFARIPNDLYRTFDPRALAALAPHLPRECRFVEPCAGHGDLIALLESAGHICIGSSDIEPMAPGIQRGDALRLRQLPPSAELIITNPPWSRPLLHSLIRHFVRLAPCWLLFDAAWAFTGQSRPFMPWLVRVVPVGRLRWIPDTSDDGKDDAAWYHFDARHDGPTILEPRR